MARKCAVIDGCGKDAEVHLFLEHEDGQMDDLPWPDDWPDWVSHDFLVDHGFNVTVA